MNGYSQKGFIKSRYATQDAIDETIMQYFSKESEAGVFSGSGYIRNESTETNIMYRADVSFDFPENTVMGELYALAKNIERSLSEHERELSKSIGRALNTEVEVAIESVNVVATQEYDVTATIMVNVLGESISSKTNRIKSQGSHDELIFDALYTAFTHDSPPIMKDVEVYAEVANFKETDDGCVQYLINFWAQYPDDALPEEINVINKTIFDTQRFDEHLQDMDDALQEVGLPNAAIRERGFKNRYFEKGRVHLQFWVDVC